MAVTAFLTAGLVTKFWKVNLFPVLVRLPDDVINDFYGYALPEMSIHRIHYLALALSHLVVTFGVAIQLWTPTRWIGADVAGLCSDSALHPPPCRGQTTIAGRAALRLRGPSSWSSSWVSYIRTLRSDSYLGRTIGS